MNKLHSLPDAPGRRRWPRRPTPPTPATLSTPPVIQLIADLRYQSRVVVKGMIRSTGTVTVSSGPAYHFALVDGSGELDVLFPGRSMVPGLPPSTRIIAEGTVGSYGGKLALWNPRYSIEPAG